MKAGGGRRLWQMDGESLVTNLKRRRAARSRTEAREREENRATCGLGAFVVGVGDTTSGRRQGLPDGGLCIIAGYKHSPRRRARSVDQTEKYRVAAGGSPAARQCPAAACRGVTVVVTWQWWFDSGRENEEGESEADAGERAREGLG